MIAGLFALICFVTPAHAPEWQVSGDAAALDVIEQQVSELQDAEVRRGTAPDGSARLWLKVPGELHLRDVSSLLSMLSRGHVEGRAPPPIPYYCPYGGADRWREGLAGPPDVGVFGTPEEIARVRDSNPWWHYAPARLADGRVGVEFTPGTGDDEQDSYAEFLSQVQAEFGAIDIVLVERVSE